jgi:hypothetical protein
MNRAFSAGAARMDSWGAASGCHERCAFGAGHYALYQAHIFHFNLISAKYSDAAAFSLCNFLIQLWLWP